MAVLGLHVFLQRGLNKLQREMCHKTSVEINSINNNLMHGNNAYAQNTTFIIIIQLCVNKIILQFSTLNPIPVFNPASENCI